MKKLNHPKEEMWGTMKIPDLQNTGKDEREDHKSVAKTRCVIRSQMKGKAHLYR